MRRYLTLATIGLMACGGGGGGNEGAADGGDAGGGEPAATTAAQPLGTGRIEGVALLNGSAPANPSIDMSEEPACVEKHGGAPVDPVVVVQARPDGSQGLANVFVRVVAGLPAGPYPAPAGAAVVDQDGCLYRPRVLGLVAGQDLEIRNSDPLLHNIKAVPADNRGFNVSQPRAGMTTTRQFDTPEVMVPLECNVHGWMHAYVGVVEHPYFATSRADGSFVIEGLPAGTYSVEAWHESFGTVQMPNIEVTDGGTGTATVTFETG